MTSGDNLNVKSNLPRGPLHMMDPTDRQEVWEKKQRDNLLAYSEFERLGKLTSALVI